MNKEYLTKQVIAYQNGDEAAFGQIYSLISDKLFRHAMVMMKNRSEAEDLLQDTMIQIVKSIGTLRDPAAFTTWSVQIMRNVYMHQLRKTKAVLARDEEDLEIIENITDEDWSYRPDTVVDVAGIGDIVKEELERLPEAQRTAMVAFYYDGLSVREIAEMMGASENTTKSRLFAGRKAMKHGIEKYEQRTGVRLHEFAPASILIGALRQIFAGAEYTLGAALQRIFQQVVEATGLSLAKLPVPKTTAPQSTPQPGTRPAPQTGTQSTPQQAPQTGTQPTPQQAPQSAPQQAPQTSSQPTPQQPPQPAPQQAPQSAPQTGTQSTPQQVPQTGTQPAPQQAPQSAPQQAPQPAPQQAPQSAPRPTSQSAPRPTLQQAPQPTPQQAPRPTLQPSPAQTPTYSASQPSLAQTPTYSAPQPSPVQTPVQPAPTPAPGNPSMPRGVDSASHAGGIEDQAADKAAEEARRLERQKARKAQNDDLAELNQNRAKNERRKKNIREEMRASRFRLVGRAALIRKLIAGLLAVGLLGGAGAAVLKHFAGGASAERMISDYSKAYLSVLYMYEKDIRDYDWQYYFDVEYHYGFTDTPVSQTEGAPDFTARPCALKDIDQDGVPELFIMTSVIDSRTDSVVVLDADLHIFTYKDGKLRELKYEMDYPGEHPAEYYEEWFGYYGINHNGRMVHFTTGVDPSSTYVIFTGKTAGTLYILTTNTGSEEYEIRMRKYSMESDAGSSGLSILSETFVTDALAGIFTSDDPAAEMNAAIEDMDDMVLYGGQEGFFSYGSGQYLPDAKTNGWHSVDDYGSVSIAPEKFQGCLSMTYDEIVAYLLGQVIEEDDDSNGSTSDDPGAFVQIKRDGTLEQAGNTLFRYDYDTGRLNYGRIGSKLNESFDGDAVAGIGSIYSDGNSIVYLAYSNRDEWLGAPTYLKKYDLASGTEELLYEFEGVPDPNVSHYIGAVYDGVAYIGFTDKDRLWAFNLESGELTALNEHGYMQERSGKYVLVMGHSTLNPQEFMPADIYELTGDGMKHVASLGSSVSVATDVIDGKFYYTVYSDNQQTAEVHRRNPDGSGDEQIAHFHLDNGNNILVEKFTSTYCIVWFGSLKYKYIYETGEGIPLN